MPVITIKINQEMFKTLKKNFPYHGDISRIVRSAIKAINKGLEFSAEGDILRINEIPVVCLTIGTHLSLIEGIEDDEKLKKLAIKNADSVNEYLYVKGVHSKEAIKAVFSSMMLSNIIEYKWVEPEDQGGTIIVYIEKTIYPPRIMKIYFKAYVEYLCKLNRLHLEISGDDSAPIYRIMTGEGSVLI
ncbi:MAG: hypothetical protein GF364_03665 [Candidatus Lokiarchaeota archaeon]|nr:hypothetical protein [Candidatus Lokiarchaeota archaeon]